MTTLAARADTLALRLFLLMLGALVVSHLVAWGLGHRLLRSAPMLSMDPPAAQAPVRPGPPPFDPGPDDRPPPPPPMRAPAAAPGLPPLLALPPMGLDSRGAALPAADLAFDLGVRLLIIALAAWWGSRWLARPMGRLVGSAQALVPALARGQPAPVLDDRHGTAEVRDAARAFNAISARLKHQFDGRGLMIAAISHDLRTPLTRMRVRLATEAVPAALRERCEQDLREMAAIIDTVMDVFNRTTATRARPVDLGALLQAVVDDTTELGHTAELAPFAPVRLQTDPLALQRVVANLVGNAVRYGERARVRVLTDAARAVIQVDDDGPGVPPDRLAALTEPFVRLETSRNRGTGGVGLGLYIARELTEQLGGRLVLLNLPGGGLRAEVHLSVANRA